MGAEELIDFLENGNIRNSVNMPAASSLRCGKARITIIQKNQPNMIAAITDVISKSGMNIENFENKNRGDVAYSILDLDSDDLDSVVSELEKLDGVVRVRTIK